MPISSFHGLRKNSVPANSWNSTRTSTHRSSSRGSPASYNGRKTLFGVPRLWDNDNHAAFEKNRDYDETKYSKSYSNGRISRKLSVSNRPRSARLADRGLKRRDTFPRFAGEIDGSSRRTEARQGYRRSKSDPSITAEKTRRKSSGSTRTIKRPSTL